jgi:acetylornithine deacetylase/succinyl-diaminopimelate desuccinylase-like protein
MRKYILALIILGSFLSPLCAKASQPLTPAELLQRMIPIDTTNPPGNETKLAEWIQAYLARFGIASEVLESAPGRGNLIARLKGSGEKEPILLLGHLDVVPADPAEWATDPFQPAIADGYLYGRGAMDMKGMVAMEVAAFVRLKSLESELRGDVILALVADEESGGKFGAQWLVENHWDKVQAAFVLNEGSIGLMREEIRLYPIQVAEKGLAWMKLSASGTSGHGAMPIRENAVLILMNGLERLSRTRQPILKTPIVDEFLKRLAARFSFPRSFLLRHFFSWPIRRSVDRFFAGKIEKEKTLNAMVRNTVTPTVLSAGNKTNVIPARAEAQIDARILPGETPEGFRQKVEAIVDDPRIKVELITQSLPTESPFQTPYFEALEATIRSQDPDALIAPYISPGGTDNRFFREKGIVSYGLIPAVITPEDLGGLHGKNERIPLAELEKGEQIILGFVWKLQGDPRIALPASAPAPSPE